MQNSEIEKNQDQDKEQIDNNVQNNDCENENSTQETVRLLRSIRRWTISIFLVVLLYFVLWFVFKTC